LHLGQKFETKKKPPQAESNDRNKVRFVPAPLSATSITAPIFLPARALLSQTRRLRGRGGLWR
jgi:hypothetical protein